MLGEHEHPDRRVSLFDGACRFEAFGGVGWRHADVDHHEVWRSRGFGWMVEVVEQLVRVCEGGNNVVAFIAKQPRQSFAEERLVLGDHNAHGMLAITVVPVRPELTVRVPPTAASRSAIPAMPEPRFGVAPPMPLSVTRRTRAPSRS